MKHINRPRAVAALAVVATVLALGATWLVAGAAGPAPEPTHAPEATLTAPESAQTPLPDFQPSERLPAGSAVTFPTDI